MMTRDDCPPIFLCQICDQTPERGHAPDCPGTLKPVEPMMVWVVTSGCYSSQGVDGVYVSAEAAMADQPETVGGDWVRDGRLKQPVKWTQDPKSGAWDNNGDWNDARSIEPYEVKGRTA